MMCCLFLAGQSCRAQIATVQNVEWIMPANIVVTAGAPGSGSSLTKNAGGAAWNADSISARRIRGDGWVQFRFLQNGAAAMLGLDLNDTNNSYTSINFAIYGKSDGTFTAYESGTARTMPAPPPGRTYSYTTTNIFTIKREGSTITYWKDDWNFYTSNVTSIGSLLVDCSIYTVNAGFQECKYFGPAGVEDVIWEGPAPNPTESYPSTDSGSTLTNPATAGWKGEYSTKRLVGDGFVQFQFSANNKRAGLGLSLSSGTYIDNDFDYGIRATGTAGQFAVTESGSDVYTGSGFAAADVFRIQRQGSTVSYYRNDGPPFYVSMKAVTSPSFVVKAALYTASASIKSVQYTADIGVEKVIWASTASVTATYDSAFSSVANATSTSGWISGTVSQKRIPHDGFFRFSFSGSPLAVAGLSATNPGGVNTAVEFGIQVSGNTAQVIENGVLKGSAFTYSASDVFAVRRVGSTIQYWQNGVLRYSETTAETASLYAAVAFNGPGQVVDADLYGAPKDILWRNRVGAVASHPSPGAGSTITKSGTTAAWDATANGNEVIPGDGYFEFRAGTAANKAVFGGLTDPSTAKTYSTFKYAIYLLASGGTYQIRETNTVVSSGSYVANDVFRIERAAGVIHYYKNGVLIDPPTPQSSSENLLPVFEGYTVNAALLGCQFYSHLSDSNSNGIDDVWEYAMFGTLDSSSGGSGDPDGDGYSNLAEFIAGSDARDYYNGLPIQMVKGTGDLQFQDPLTFLSTPLSVTIKAADGSPVTCPAGAVVSLTASNGALLSLATDGSSPIVSSLTAPLASNGALAVPVYVKLPPSGVASCTVQVTYNYTSVTFTENVASMAMLFHFDEASGTTALDASGLVPQNNGAIGSIARVPSFSGLTAGIDTAGWIPAGGALQLSSSSDTMTVAASSSNAVTGAISVFAWVKMGAWSANREIAAHGFQFVVTGSASDRGLRLTMGSSSLIPRMNCVPLIFDGKPHLVGFVHDATGKSWLYLDGVDVSTPVGGTAPSMGSFANTGAWTFGTSYSGINGTPMLLDEVRVILAAAPATYVQSLFDRDQNGLPDYWELKNLNQIGANPAGDPDADGLSNVTEYIYQHDPNVPDNSQDGSGTGVRMVAVSAGGGHSLGLAADGSVYGWGLNSYGQLGTAGALGATVNLPTKLAGLQKVVSLAAGTYSSFAILQDTSVVAWGYNASGNLAVGNTTNQTTATAVTQTDSGTTSPFTNAKAIASNAWVTIACKYDGTLWTAGSNYLGQRGDNTSAATPGAATNQTTLKKVTMPAGKLITAVAAGRNFCMALAQSGEVYVWGSNGSAGILGQGSLGPENSAIPVLVPQPSLPKNIVSIAAGARHCLALTSDGVVYGWGASDGQQLGTVATGFATPTAIPGLSGAWFLEIAAGNACSFARDNQGQLWSWGSGSQAGRGTAGPLPPGVIAAVGTALSEVSCGENDPTITSLSNATSYALSATGRIYAWGLATGSSLGFSPYAETFAPTGLTTTGRQALRVLSGDNQDSDLNGVVPNALTVRVANEADEPLVNVPVTFSLAVGGGTLSATAGGTGTTTVSVNTGSDGTARAYYVLPIPTHMVQAVQAVSTYGNVYFHAAGPADKIYAGGRHSIAIRQGGVAYSWGADESGQLLLQDYAEAHLPQVMYDGILGIATGEATTFLRAVVDLGGGSQVVGGIAGGGANSGGILGLDTRAAAGSGNVTYFTASNYPLFPRGLDPAKDNGSGIAATQAIASGSNFVAAVTSAGTLKTWGDNTYGQLGLGSIGPLPDLLRPPVVGQTGGTAPTAFLNNDDLPRTVPGLGDVAAASCGVRHLVVLKNDGTVWTTGDNSSGQLGDGTNISRAFFARVPVLSDIVAVAAGETFTAALDAHGQIWAFGDVPGAYDGYIPTRLPSWGAYVGIAASPDSLAALNSTGDILVGGNYNASLSSSVIFPYKLSSLTNATWVSTSSDGTLGHGLAIVQRNGESIYYAWGCNSNGQLGDGTAKGSATPVLVRCDFYHDTDGDGIPDVLDTFVGKDSNGDGLDDFIGLRLGFLSQDDDGDGLTNAQELLLGTNPFLADSDGDGVPDNLDAYPNDPTRTTLSPHAGDTVPPVINLIGPAGAIPLP
jgi:alpha-tubulin suppressor-like RCC1 family protein